MEILNYVVSDGQSGIRIDRYLSDSNEDLFPFLHSKASERTKGYSSGNFCQGKL